MKQLDEHELELIAYNLTRISELIDKVYRNQNKKKKFIADKGVYYKWKIHKLKHSERGITDLKSSYQLIGKQEWHSAVKEIVDIAKTSSDYTIAIEALKQYLHEEVISKFANKIAYLCLEKKFRKNSIRKLIKVLTKDLNGLMNYWVVAEIIGLAIQPSEIKINSIINLRKTKKKDLEGLQDHWTFSSSWSQTPSVLIRVKATREDIIKEKSGDIFKSTLLRKLQEELSKVICLLRLFKVGGIKLLSTKMNSDSPIPLMLGGKLSSHDNLTPPFWAYIRRNDVKKIKAFFNVMLPSLPVDIYNFESIKLTPIAIANDFYTEAVTKGEPIEKRISYVIMGLEALFLENNMEVSYRLRIRVGKFLGNLGLNSHSVSQAINDGYKIRSKYAHGDVLSTENRKKYAGRHGSLEILLKTLLDYLRIAVIMNIFMKKSKMEFARLIDDSLIDQKMDNALKIYLKKWKKYVV